MTVPQRAIGWLSGNPQQTSIGFLVTSFTDAAITVAAYSTEARTGSPVATRTINASAGAAPALAKYADDRSSADPAGETWAAWVASSTLTGLTAGTRYYITLTQGGTVESDCETWTAPAAGTNFNVYVASCDISYRNINDPTHDPGPGCWPMFRDIQSRSTEPGYVVFGDDIGYADGLGYVIVPTPELLDDTGYTGKAMTDKASISGLAYDYAMTYLALLGVFGNTDYPAIAWGRDEYRNWCVRKLPWALQWGDHEIIDDIGASATASTAYAQWPGAVDAWDNFFGLLRPVPAGGDIRVSDTGARHWMLELGDLAILCPDGVTNMSGGNGNSVPWSYATVLGTTQINDILTAAAGSSAPFKLLHWAYIHERTWEPLPAVEPRTPVIWYTQQPLYRMQPTEWKRLYFNASQTPKALMDLPGTNGVTGCLLTSHGDVHRPHVIRHYGYHDGTDTTDGLRADWISIYCAAATRAVGSVSPVAVALADGEFHQGMQMLYRHPSVRAQYEAIDPDEDYTPSGLHIHVQGARPVKQLRADLLQSKYGTEHLYRVVWTGTWRVGSNRPVDVMCRDEDMQP